MAKQRAKAKESRENVGKLKILTTTAAEKQSDAPWGRLLLLVICPLFVQFIGYTNVHLNGSFWTLFQQLYENGLANMVYNHIWGPYFFGSFTAWKIIGTFAAVELLFMKLLPGETIKGPETINHNFPIYKANGFLAFVTTVALFCTCSFYLELFPASIVHDHLMEILGALNASSLLFCLVLLIKGRYFPTNNDTLSRGSWIADYYWGVELYPTILTFHVKQFTNSRFGMMSWPLFLLSYAAKQHALYGEVSDSMIVSVALQFFYVGTFFWYERGYFFTMDIQHDRAGFYLCWGCLVWVPCVYTSPGMYLVHHPIHLGWVVCGGLILMGVLCFWMKTNANRQRLNVRATNGEYKIWGRTPKIIRAKFLTEKGETKENILLVDGWWKVSRHAHYLGEIIGALCWSLPGGFTHFMPYFYVVFLTLLLSHRASRDDIRCSIKYGKYWDQYRAAVPYKVLPGVY